MNVVTLSSIMVEEKSNYLTIIEFNKGKEIKKGYAHKKCWDDFLNQRKNMEEAMGMMRGLKGKLIEFGLLPKKKIIIP